MKIPLTWLQEYVDINLSTEELTERLTLAGMEVEGVERIGDWWDPETVVVGSVVSVLPHPDADRLVLVDVDYGGDEPQRVVTGAPNLYQFKGAESLPVLKVCFARSGAMLVDAYSDKQPRPMKKLKPSKIRGIKSSGMVCSELELGLSEEHEGILFLPEDAPIGIPLRDYLGAEIIELDLTPDMARCLNMIGVAREVAALTEASLRLPTDECQSDGGDQASDYVDVRIDDPELCNRYTGIMIKDIQIGPSPKWMQDRLNQAGMRPINNVVDITNYVMLEWGQPLHAFDYDILKQRANRLGDEKPTIIVARAKDGEKFTTLDDIEREMDTDSLMIQDRGGSIAIGGIMGGQESEVSEETTNVLLEAATFEGINNRRTSQRLRLPSEASYRFARGIPATLNPIASHRAAELMRRYAGGRIVPGMVDIYPVEQQPPVVYTTQSDTRRLLGMDIKLDEIKRSLERLDFVVEQVDEVADNAHPDATFALHRDADEPLLACTGPWHRLDIRYPADLTEEVARIIGYEHVGTTLLNETLPTQWRNHVWETDEQVRNILVGCGLQETINNPLTTPENHKKLATGPASSNGHEDAFVSLTNPISPERHSLRRTLLVSALENLARNQRFANRLTTFEIGRVYHPEAGEGTLPAEDSRVSILLSGGRRITNFHPDPMGAEAFDFFDLKGIIEALFAQLGFDESTIEYRAKPDADPFGPRCAEVVLNDKPVGLIGEVHPKVRTAFDIDSDRVCAAELRLSPLVKPEWEVVPLPPISDYPPVIEDLAFEVSEEVTVRSVQNVIERTGGEIVADVELFDIYRGEPIPVSHKSLAYRLTYQSPKRSLSEKEVSKLRQRIIRSVEKETGGKLRG